MYMAQYRQFSGYNAVVLNHTVDVDGNNHAGIRWYELRETGGTWSLYQEGTYAPDDDNRWCGSICMDYLGNIGLAYSVSGSSTFPSIRYTGRLANDPTGQLTIAEDTIVNGGSSKESTSGNRFGDYAQLTIDPVDDATFWFTGEYIDSEEWKTRIVSFKLEDLSLIVEQANDGIKLYAETLGNDRFKLFLKGTDDKVSVSVFNTIGQVLYRKENVAIGNDGFIIDMKGKAGAYYIINVKGRNFSKIVKVTTR